jgi:hypothetical protein
MRSSSGQGTTWKRGKGRGLGDQETATRASSAAAGAGPGSRWDTGWPDRLLRGRSFYARSVTYEGLLAGRGRKLGAGSMLVPSLFGRASGQRHPARPCGGTANTWVALPRSPRILAPTERGICRTSHRVRPAQPFLTESACSPTFNACPRRSWLVTGARQCPSPAYRRARPDGSGVERA